MSIKYFQKCEENVFKFGIQWRSLLLPPTLILFTFNPTFRSTFKQTMFSQRVASSSQWLSERFSVPLPAAVLYLLLICIDLSHGLPFYWCQRAERALQYTMFSLRSYRAGNEKQMAPLCRDVWPPGWTGLWSEGRNWKGHKFTSLDNDKPLLPPLAKPVRRLNVSAR